MAMNRERSARVAPATEHEGDGHAKTAQRLRQSDAIKVARVLCVCSVVYVHAWLEPPDPRAGHFALTGTGLLIYLAQNLLGRSSVPLLSIISGWLVLGTVQRTRYRELVEIKARSLLFPMIAWNLIALAVFVAFSRYETFARLLPRNPGEVIAEVFALPEGGRINAQIYFLRDLFVCMLAAPLLVRSRTVVLAAVLGALSAIYVLHLPVFVLVRPDIALFFAAGILIRRLELPTLEIGRYSAAITIGFALAAGWYLLRFFGPWGPDIHAPWIEAGELACRVIVAISFWCLAVALSRSAAVDVFRRLEPGIFFLFGGQILILRLVCPVLADRWTGGLGSPTFLLFYLLEPLIALVASQVLLAVTVTFAAPLTVVLSGGRAGVRRGSGAIGRSAASGDPA